MEGSRCRVLKGGQSLLIFPEGTRTGWDRAGEAASWARCRSGLAQCGDDYAVVMKMTPPNFKKGQPWSLDSAGRKSIMKSRWVKHIDPQSWLAESRCRLRRRRLNRDLPKLILSRSSVRFETPPVQAEIDKGAVPFFIQAEAEAAPMRCAVLKHTGKKHEFQKAKSNN